MAIRNAVFLKKQKNLGVLCQFAHRRVDVLRLDKVVSHRVMSQQDTPAMKLKGERSTACVVLITTPSQEEAQRIAGTLVEERLAACVSIIQIESIYRWDGKICADPEWQLVVKTQFDVFSALEKRVADLHSYDLPEIIAVPITIGSSSYLKWIATEVHSPLPLSDDKSGDSSTD